MCIDTLSAEEKEEFSELYKKLKKHFKNFTKNKKDLDDIDIKGDSVELMDTLLEELFDITEKLACICVLSEEIVELNQ